MIKVRKPSRRDGARPDRVAPLAAANPARAAGTKPLHGIMPILTSLTRRRPIDFEDLVTEMKFYDSRRIGPPCLQGRAM